MQLGIYSFGSRAADIATGEQASTAQAMRNLLEAIRLADEVGLDYFGIGEHHSWEMPASAASTILAAAASVTSRILLGSAVTVLSTEDPVRLYQQFATVDALSNGRAEITAGRGSFTDSFPLFGADLAEYDRLYTEKLDLLLRIDADPVVSWSGTTREALQDALVVPRPDRGHLPIWLGTGGTPGSSARAGALGLPVAYGVIGGQPERFARLADLYRESFRRAGHAMERARVAIGNFGFIADTREKAMETYYEDWHRAMTGGEAARRGFRSPVREQFDVETVHGALFVGEPERIAERIISLHGSMGHMRQFFQMDLSRVPQRDYLRSIELLGTRVKPIVDAELGPEPQDLRDSVLVAL